MLQLIFSVNTLWWLMLFMYIPACFGLIIIVLLQKGKGQGLAGAFGMGGGMDTIFGPRSSKSLPQKITYASAGVFMTLALIMSILSGKVGRSAAPELAADTPDASLDALFHPAADDAAAVTEGLITPSEEDPAPDAEMPAFTADMEDADPEMPVFTVEVDDAEPETPDTDEPILTEVEAPPAEEDPAEEAPAEDDAAEAADAPPMPPITVIDMGEEPEAPAE